MEPGEPNIDRGHMETSYRLHLCPCAYGLDESVISSNNENPAHQRDQRWLYHVTLLNFTSTKTKQQRPKAKGDIFAMTKSKTEKFTEIKSKNIFAGIKTYLYLIFYTEVVTINKNYFI
jgi:hypothetical protein